DRINTLKLFLKSDRKESVNLRLGLREAPFVWDFRSEDDIKVVETDVPAQSEGWVEFNFNVKVSPGKLYYVYTNVQPGIFWKSFKDEDNKPSQVPIGTTAAVLPEKSTYRGKSAAFRELFPDVQLTDIPGAGKEGHWKPLTMGRSLCIQVTPESRPYNA